MRIDFKSTTPVDDQLARAQKRKQKGHKHSKSLGPGVAKPRNLRIKEVRAKKAYDNRMTEYFRGNADMAPKDYK